MIKVTSVSGGKTSAYIAANYRADALVFALVRTNEVKFKDDYLRKMVENKIQKPFIGTLENDIIISTIFDLEQYTGQEISWVTGQTFEEVIKYKKILPNIAMRFCTTELKMRPIFHWWYEKYSEPVEMNIGYRVTEQNRAKRMLEKCNEQGLNEFKATFEKVNNRNKWQTVAWRKPAFPLIYDMIDQHDINDFWKDKPVRFSEFNNCIGCPNFRTARLKHSATNYPNKFDWFINQESKIKGQWKKEISYQKIKELPEQFDAFKGTNGCDSGFCGM